MRAWLSVAAFVLVALAGCADSSDGGEDPASVDDGLGGGQVDQNATQNLTAPVPVLGLSADNGTAPWSVNVTVDAEGNVSAWSLDFGDGNATEGDEVPAVVNHTYAPGLHTLVLTVQGPGGNATMNATVNVTSGAADVVLEPFSETVGLDIPCPGCDQGTLTCTWRAHGQDAAQDCAWIDFPDELAGQPFTLTGNGLDPDVLFWTTCGDGPGARFTEELAEESGIVPEGAGCALVWEKVDFLIDVTLAITPE